MNLKEYIEDIDASLAQMGVNSQKKNFLKNGEIRASYYTKVSSFISAGVPIMKVLFAIKQQKERRKKPEKDTEYVVTVYLLGRMSEGYGFSDALREIIPGDEYMLISAGEKSGELPKNIAMVCQGIIDNGKIKKAIKGALMYPSVMVVMLIGLYYALGAKMLPTLVNIAPVTDWAPEGRLLYHVSNAIVDNISIIISTIILLVIFLIWSVKHLVNDFRLDYMDRVHPYKIYRTIQSTFFLLAMGSLLKSGIKTSTALTFLKENSNKYTKAQISIMIERLAAGLTASAVISTQFLGESADDIELYGMAGNFDQALVNTANLAKEKTEESISSFSQAFGTIMFMMVGLSAVWGIYSFLGISNSIAMSQAG